MKRQTFLFGALGLIAAAATPLAAAASPAKEETPGAVERASTPEASATLLFERHVRPILKTHCFGCHGEQTRKGGLNALQARLLIRGGESGPALVPGRSAESRLFERISKGEMPPGQRAKLTPEQIALIGRWIDAGAPTESVEKELHPQEETFVTAEDQRTWAYQPPQRPPIPMFKSTDRVRTPIDAFLFARLRKAKLGFSPDADEVTLIRRASLDLTGLPPTPAEVDAFVADTAPDAYERLVRRLLDSPNYGERWGRHWLDIAGYADSDGYTDDDRVRPWAYRYRDYVIKSFNDDKPYDQFLVEQLAGDELIGWPGAPLTPKNREMLVATGFLRNAADGTAAGNIDRVMAANQVIADTIEITMTGLVGLTVQCAQCHNHRYDPISQKDYFRIRAVFEPAYDTEHWRQPDARRISLVTPEQHEKMGAIDAAAKKVVDERNALTRKHIEEIFAEQIEKVPEAERQAYRDAFKTERGKRTAEQKKLLNKYPAANVTAGVIYQYRPDYRKQIAAFDKKVAEIRKDRPVEAFIRALTEVPGQVSKSVLFIRGDYRAPGHDMSPGVLSVLTDLSAPARIEPKLDGHETTGRRLQLARWLTRPDHPLTARVWVNRVWMHHFGEGIVRTVSDFGSMGEPPTHPELLDWLACEFVAGGWRLKRLHEMIMTSTAYRQSSRRHESGTDADPDNDLLWRTRVRRVEGEVLRDSILAVSGALNTKPGGPAVPVREDAHGRIVVGKENFVGSHQPGPMVDMKGEQFRRSVYLQVRRSKPLTLLKAFDVPVMETNCTRRSSSVTPMQALGLLNGDFVVRQARRFAERVARQTGADTAKRITLAYRLALCRVPDAAEIEQATEFLKLQTEYLAARDAAAHADATARHAREAFQVAEARLIARAQVKGGKDKATNKKAVPAPPKTEGPAPALWALANFCHVLLTGNEFLYVD